MPFNMGRVYVVHLSGLSRVKGWTIVWTKKGHVFCYIRVIFDQFFLYELGSILDSG